MLEALILFLFLLPWQWAVPLGDFGDVPIWRLTAIVCIGMWFTWFLLRARTERIPLELSLPILGFLGISLLSVGSILEPDEIWLRKWVFLAGLLPLGCVWFSMLQSPRSTLLIKALILGAISSALFGLFVFFLQLIFSPETLFLWLTKQAFPIFLGERLAQQVALFPSLMVNISGVTWLRLTAVFPDPHVAAFFFGMTGFLSAGFFFETKRYWWLSAAIVLMVADLLTFSRGGYLGLVSGLLILLFFRWRNRSYASLVVAGLALAPLVAWSMFPVVARFTSTFTLSDGSSLERFRLWGAAIKTWSTQPWLGVGLGQYADRALPWIGTELPYYAHNLYLDIGVELGLLGLACFLLLVGLALRRAWLAALRGDGFAQGISAGLAAYLVHSGFETALFSLHVTSVLIFMVALAYRKRTMSFSSPAHL